MQQRTRAPRASSAAVGIVMAKGLQHQTLRRSERGVEDVFCMPRTAALPNVLQNVSLLRALEAPCLLPCKPGVL